MTKRVLTRSSPKHRSLRSSSRRARNHRDRDPGTGTRSRAEPSINIRMMIRSRRRRGRKTEHFLLNRNRPTYLRALTLLAILEEIRLAALAFAFVCQLSLGRNYQ